MFNIKEVKEVSGHLALEVNGLTASKLTGVPPSNIRNAVVTSE
jgi:hypothetical protein